MAAPSANKYIVTAADIGRFLIIALMGFASAVTFLVAGTVTVLMVVDSAACDCFRYYPVGLSVLGLLGLLLLIDMIIVAVDAPPVVEKFFKDSKQNQEMLMLSGICFVVFFIILH